MKERDAADDERIERALHTIKETWEIEPPPGLTQQIMSRVAAAQERPDESEAIALDEARQRAFFGVVAWSFTVVFVISSLLTGAALLYARESRGLLLAMLWGGMDL